MNQRSQKYGVDVLSFFFGIIFCFFSGTVPRVVLTIPLFTETPAGRKGASEFLLLIRKRNQTNQLQTKLLTSGPGGRRFKSSLPDQSFSRSFSCLGGFCRLSFFAYFRYIRYN